MADARVMKEKEQETEVNEAQIAVHWKEEQYFYPSSRFIGQAYLTDPAVDQRFSEKNFPECFREYADLLSWDHARYQRCPFLEVVCRRQTQRFL
jgi:hypothetical protein